MGRAYIVDESVEVYLSRLCETAAGPGPGSGLLLGQSSPQRDFVVMAIRTPHREEAAAGSSLDKEWVTEHARQVSRMLPAGLSVLGIFIITDTEAKDSLTSLQQLVFAVDTLISTEQLWGPAHDDITDRVTLHVNSKTRKTVCRTFDVRDPKSAAKPADWRYQSGVCSSWTTVSCWVDLDVIIQLPETQTSIQSMDTCVKEGLSSWVQRVEGGVCLMDGKKLEEDWELTGGQRRNVKHTHVAQLLITADERRLPGTVWRCGGSLSIKGAIHSRAYVHSNKPTAGHAHKLLKRDVVSTVTTRVQMVLEDLLMAQERHTHTPCTEQLLLPRRLFCPVKGAGPVCVCDYQFGDEGMADVTDRLKEMLDVDAAEKDLDGEQEVTSESVTPPLTHGSDVEPHQTPQSNKYLGVAMATAVALLATAASLLYLDQI
ncbi:protein odr-4 homolog isoform X2 [Genypterus blacodes]|uniref:protein odr-4 homolog isoform X2 n=1 Tax=Genypterus blacodes TaxID=154954 RepID=UPI003F772C09